MKRPKKVKLATCFDCNEYMHFGVCNRKPFAFCPKCEKCIHFEREMKYFK